MVLIRVMDSAVGSDHFIWYSSVKSWSQKSIDFYIKKEAAKVWQTGPPIHLLAVSHILKTGLRRTRSFVASMFHDKKFLYQVRLKRATHPMHMALYTQEGQDPIFRIFFKTFRHYMMACLVIFDFTRILNLSYLKGFEWPFGISRIPISFAFC